MATQTLQQVQKIGSTPKLVVKPVSFQPISPTQAVKPAQFFNPEQAWKNEFMDKFSNTQPGLLDSNPLEVATLDLVEQFKEKLPIIVVAIIAVLVMIVSLGEFVKDVRPV